MPGRSPSGWASPHYVLDFEARFRAAVIDDFADDLRRRADADPLRPLQPARQVPRPAADRARPGGRGAGHRPLCAPRRGPRRPRAAPRRRRRPRPELFPVRDHAGAARLSSAFRWATWPNPRRGGRRPAWVSPSRRSPTARTSASCRRRLCGLVGRLRPEALTPGDIVDRAGSVLGRHRGHRALHGRPAARPRHRGRRAAVCRRHRCRDAPGRRGAARAALSIEAGLGETSWLAPPIERAGLAVKHRANEPAVPATVEAARRPAAACASPRRSAAWRPARPASSMPARGCWAAA